MKHLFNDTRNRMTTEFLSTELKIRLNSTISCNGIYKYILSDPDLLEPSD